MNERPKYRRSKNCIELIITYECNRKCFNCEAMVRQAPSIDAMSCEQIEKFVRESIVEEIKWTDIRVLGGEPTMHDDIEEILLLLLSYKNTFSPQTNITVVTNGFGKKVNEMLERINSLDVIIENSYKSSDVQPHFHPVNLAPIDMQEYCNKEVNNGCWITSICGIALDYSGYFTCSTAAAIDRVFGFDLGRKKLPSVEDEMSEQYNAFCKLCGHYHNSINQIIQHDVQYEEDFRELDVLIKLNQKKFEQKEQLYTEIISPTWEDALTKWSQNKIVRSRY